MTPEKKLNVTPENALKELSAFVWGPYPPPLLFCAAGHFLTNVTVIRPTSAGVYGSQARAVSALLGMTVQIGRTPKNLDQPYAPELTPGGDMPFFPLIYINDTSVIFLDVRKQAAYGVKIETDILSERRYVSRKDNLHGWEAECLLAVVHIKGRNTDGIT